MEGWKQLCHEAEKELDRDGVRFEAEWLPAALERLEGWPKSLRRCPSSWFETPRERVERKSSPGPVVS